MKKTISIFLTLCIVFVLLLTSCEKPVTDNMPNGSDIITDSTGNQSTNPATDASTEKQTEKQTEKETDKPDKNEDPETPDDPEITTVTPTLNINGKSSEWDLEEGISTVFNTTSNLANAKFEVNIPVAEAGSYKLNFDTRLGLTKIFTSGTKKVTLSLPKAVFNEGEPIPVAYSTSGLTSSAANQNPWLSIAKNVGGVDKYISWEYLEKNTSGIIDASLMTGVRQDNSVLDYVWLPVGEYKIYFIDDSYVNLQNSKYWLHDAPIHISIVPKDNVGTTVTRSGTAYGSASISVKNNIFRQGESVYVSFTANNLKTPYSDYQPWVGISKTFDISGTMQDYYTHWDYTNTTDNGTFRFDSGTGNYAQGSVSVNVEAYRSLPEGSYKIHYVNGPTFQDCINYVEPIGINVAPKATLNASVGNKSVLSTDNPYDNKFVDETITVTEADVTNGYVTVSFSFGSLKANTNYYLTVNNVSLVKQ